MKSINADLNRRGLNGTVVVAARRFEEMPEIGDHFIVVDGEDKFEGTVYQVLPERRSVLLKMSWDSNSLNHRHQFALSVGDSGARTNGDRPTPLAGAPTVLRSDQAIDRNLTSV